MADLPRPYEILELADGQSVTFRVKAWTEGTIRIFPTDWEARVSEMLRRGSITEEVAKDLLRNGKEIQALRVVPPREDMPPGKIHWDITSTTLIAQLLPYLKAADFSTRRFTVKAFGVAPRKRFTLEVS